MCNAAFYRPTKAVVDLESIRHNVRALAGFLDKSTQIIAVVKANGYGHGSVQVAKAALEAGAVMLAVATPEEALVLRREGLTANILVMGSSPVSFAGTAAEQNITVTVMDEEWVQTVLQTKEQTQPKLKVHVKIDSGMGRIGLRDPAAFLSLANLLLRSDRFDLDGVFTHFARADEEDPRHTEKQFAVYTELVSMLPVRPRMLHVSNSAGALSFPQYGLDAVRYGISMYGIPPFEADSKVMPISLERAFRLETEIAFVKQLGKGEPVSYGGTYTASEDEWIATLPIGYADGLLRSLQGQEVLVGGQRAPIVGRICMDQCMVKLPKRYPVGEPVVLIGTQGSEAVIIEEWAERLDTIPHEITVLMGDRIPIIYK